MSVQINDWEEGTCEGRFYSIDEAKSYVLENEMDVIVYDFSDTLTSSSFRFNTEIHEKAEIEGIANALKEQEISGWVEEDYIETAKSLFKSGIRKVK